MCIDNLLIELYTSTGRTLDDLPYTPEFDALYANLTKQLPTNGTHLGKSQVFQQLLTLRKTSRLPRLGTGSKISPVQISQAEEAILRELTTQYMGTLGQRDRLPYTGEFNSIVTNFNRDSNPKLSEHDIWRHIARISKNTP